MKKQIALLAITLMVTACSNKQQNSTPSVTEQTVSQIVGIGKVMPRGGVIELAAPSSGIVKEVYFKAGDKVREGDLILLLNSTDEELLVKEAEYRLASQSLAVESAKLTLEQERIAHAERQRLLNDARELLEVGATTGENVRRLQNQFDQGTEQLKKLENELRLQQSQIREMNIQRAARLNDLDRTMFRAPMNGILLDLSPRVGEAVNMHQQYGRISPDSSLVVMAEIDELFADRLMIGQPCRITLPGDTEVAATGEIVRIAPDLKRKSLFSDSGTDLEDRRIREIEVLLNEITKALFIESKVKCSVQLN